MDFLCKFDVDIKGGKTTFKPIEDPVEEAADNTLPKIFKIDMLSNESEYELCRVPFGLNMKFEKLRREGIVFIYIDDIVIPSKDLRSAPENLRKVLHVASQTGLNINWKKCDVGAIGGLMSHEYHYISDIGEDTILQCPSINQSISETTSCPECKNELHQHIAAEVGHTFLLDTKYSQPLKAMYVEQHKSNPMVMGCFGLGLSRIITLAAEILSTNNEIRWPIKLAPYTVCIIPPKAGSKEEDTSVYVEQLSEILCKRDINAILDDRTHHTIGKRLVFARALGYPYIIVIGKTATQSVPLFEIHDVNNSTYRELSLNQISDYFDNINFKN
ncbi:probable proline--tRNA ligase, mitochondrial [Temnothorax nylanderi]|uniref:probable proline--tRNA ligase, mitochondrial n=1 Tax=Temnothorax nylanderi TaxID=102681 RepID=UPI003A85B57C